MNNNSEQAESCQTPNLQFRTQLFGGFRKADVKEYVERLETSMDSEKIALEEKRLSVLELIEKGQAFGDKLINDAKNQAAIILEGAKQEANQKRKEAEAEITRLKGEHTHILEQCQKDTNHLIDLYTRKYEDTKAAYEEMLKPLTELSQTLGDRIEQSADDSGGFLDDKFIDDIS